MTKECRTCEYFRHPNRFGATIFVATGRRKETRIRKVMREVAQKMIKKVARGLAPVEGKNWSFFGGRWRGWRERVARPPPVFMRVCGTSRQSAPVQRHFSAKAGGGGGRGGLCI